MKINNMNGVFHRLTPTKRIKDVQGGHLMWVQDGTMIELFSSRISKQELITIAQSMQNYKEGMYVKQHTYPLLFINRSTWHCYIKPAFCWCTC